MRGALRQSQDRRAVALSDDQRGAAMVFGIFFAVFLLAMVYYVYGIGQALWYRERLQDAADAAAFSGAVINAKGMNLLALINMAMAVVLAVLVALKLVEILTIAAIAVIAAVGWMTGGLLYGLLTPLAKFEYKVHDAAQDYKDNVLDSALEGLHHAGDAVRVAMPLGANARVIGMVRSKYGPHAELGVVVPASLTLPVEDDTFNELCNRAGEMVGWAFTLPLAPILPDDFRADLAKGMGGAVAAGGSWFCGGSDGEAPRFDIDKIARRELPLMPAQRICQDDTQSDSARESACAQARREALASMPNARGECRLGQPVCADDCDAGAQGDHCPAVKSVCSADERQAFRGHRVRDCAGGAFGARARQARLQCRPGPRKGGYWYRTRTFTRTYRHTRDTGWVRGAPEPGEPTLHRDVSARDFPCRKDYETAEGDPVCVPVRRCPARFPRDARGECSFKPGADVGRVLNHQPRELVETWTEVEEVLRCEEEFSEAEKRALEERTTASEDLSGSDGEDKVPFRLAEGAWLGGPDFQVRGVAFGAEPGRDAEEVIDMARWGAGPHQRPGTVRALEVAARLAAAQAEFYFDWRGIGDDLQARASRQSADTNINKEWLWYMNWRARLRPFRLQMDDAEPDDEEGGFEGLGGDAVLEAVGEKVGGRCDGEDCQGVLRWMGGGGGDG